ncbi:DNA-binding protein [Ktedonosporobacter rubrisoli]|uniref:DNA-binding protein n=1 Tax=Ktedonosporobacter rubrisoli TaxID=2509675 RepID=A0A4P6JVF8_KTERU|nr:helix-turn-helix domain-containing protein [Ktedonosporobacter rubrisoli]QBD79658.1 DNA-binding protein [Ktedonosporobacter rubrisoli]
MESDNEFLPIPGYVSIKEAAKIVGISLSRMYEHVRKRHIPARKAGNTRMIAEEDLERFRLNPPGRLRVKPPTWRAYNARNKVFSTEIDVKIKPSQQKRLIEKLEEIRKEESHTFIGSIARYILKDLEESDWISIRLVWKDTEMPDEDTQEEEMAAFRAELEDVLDWQTARYRHKEGIIYT